MKEILEEKIINKNQIFQNVTKERNVFMKKIMLYTTALAVVLLTSVLFLNTLRDNVDTLEEVKYNLVTLDINPSIGLMIDENNEVAEVLTLNDDAVVALEGVSLVGLSVDEAIDKVVDTSVEMGYIGEMSEENVVNVTTYLDNEEKNTELNDKIRTRIENRLEEKKVVALVVKNGLDEELKAKADEYEISYGKMLIISRATALDESLEEKDLLDMSIREIQVKIKEKSIENYKNVKEYYNENKDEIKAKKDEIIEKAKEKAAQIKETVLEKVENYKNLTDSEKQAIIDEKKEQIKENVSVAKDKIVSGSKEAIELIREKIQNKRGN